MRYFSWALPFVCNNFLRCFAASCSLKMYPNFSMRKMPGKVFGVCYELRGIHFSSSSWWNFAFTFCSSVILLPCPMFYKLNSVMDMNVGVIVCIWFKMSPSMWHLHVLKLCNADHYSLLLNISTLIHVSHNIICQGPIWPHRDLPG